jgi:hypothetical protein
MQSGGVAVLDSQRIHGGDVAMAYVGTYTFADRVLKADVEACFYNLASSGQFDVFGERSGPVRKPPLSADFMMTGIPSESSSEGM